MCGIVAALPVYGESPGYGGQGASPDLADLLAGVPEPPGAASEVPRDPDGAEKLLTALLQQCEAVLQRLAGDAAAVLVCDESLQAALAAAGGRILAWANEFDATLDGVSADWPAEATEMGRASCRERV